MSKGNGSSPGSLTNLEIVEARREVELAKADLRYRVHMAAETSKRVVKRVASRVGPALMVAAGLGALALAFGIVKLAQLRPRRRGWMPPMRAKRPSVVGQIVRSVLTTFVTRYAARLVANLPSLQLQAENQRPVSTFPARTYE